MLMAPRWLDSTSLRSSCQPTVTSCSFAALTIAARSNLLPASRNALTMSVSVRRWTFDGVSVGFFFIVFTKAFPFLDPESLSR
jgi:hypothetical protein